jgi:nucleoid DNA-binding protein
MSIITKSELVTQVANQATLSKSDAEKVVVALLDAIITTMLPVTF